MSDLRLLIAIPPVFFEQFVGDFEASRLAKLFNQVERLDPTEMAREDWPAIFRRFRPQALLSGWRTPHVPDEAIPPLQCVAHTCGEVRQLVSQQMIERGLVVTNWEGEAAPSVAEHALLLILASLRRLTSCTLNLHVDGKWNDAASESSVGLFDKRVGLHGFGRIAQNLVALLKPFNCEIQAYSQGVPSEVFKRHGVLEAETIEDLFRTSDVLVEVESLTPLTRRCVTDSLLRSLHPDAVFINVGRAETVDMAALTRIAQEGRLQIALDVFEVEPLPIDSVLRGLPNVTLTPHVAGPTVDRRRNCGSRAVDNLERFCRGQIPQGLITPDIYARST